MRLTKHTGSLPNHAEGDEAGDEPARAAWSRLELGEMVEVTEGPFKGMSEPVVSLGNEGEDAEAAAAAGTTIWSPSASWGGYRWALPPSQAVKKGCVSHCHAPHEVSRAGASSRATLQKR